MLIYNIDPSGSHEGLKPIHGWVVIPYTDIKKAEIVRMGSTGGIGYGGARGKLAKCECIPLSERQKDFAKELTRFESRSFSGAKRKASEVIPFS